MTGVIQHRTLARLGDHCDIAPHLGDKSSYTLLFIEHYSSTVSNNPEDTGSDSAEHLFFHLYSVK